MEVKSIQDLLSQINRDEILLPEFQRGYVWNRDQVRGLMQSLYRKHPTGHLLTWRTYKPSPVRGGGEGARAGHSLLLLDGQQRLTTLYVLFKGKAPRFYEGESLFFDLHFNMQTQEFRFWQRSQMENNPAWIGVHEFLREGLPALLERLEQLGEERRTIIQQNLARLGKLDQVRDYTYTVDQVSGDHYSVEEVVDIFNRVNSRGTPLTRADLALAHVCSLWPEARAELRAFSGKMADRGFAVDLSFLVRCLAAAATGSVLLEGSFLKTPAATLQGAWEKMQPAFEHLVSVLRQEALISGLDDLPTNFVLIPATIYLARQGGQFPSDAVRRRFHSLGVSGRAVGALFGFHGYEAAAGCGAGVRPGPGSDARTGSGHSARARSGQVAGRGSGPGAHRFIGRSPEPNRGAASRRPGLVHRSAYLRRRDRQEPGRGTAPHLSEAGAREGRIRRHHAQSTPWPTGRCLGNRRRKNTGERRPRSISRRSTSISRAPCGHSRYRWTAHSGIPSASSISWRPAGACSPRR